METFLVLLLLIIVIMFVVFSVMVIYRRLPSGSDRAQNTHVTTTHGGRGSPGIIESITDVIEAMFDR